MEKNTHRIDKNTIFQYVADDVIFDTYASQISQTQTR